MNRPFTILAIVFAAAAITAHAADEPRQTPPAIQNDQTNPQQPPAHDSMQHDHSAMQHDASSHHEMTQSSAHDSMQHDQAPAPHDHSAMRHAAMSGMHDPVTELLMRQASGVSMNPASAPMPMQMTHTHDWMLMLHGAAFVNQVVQSGPRGGDKLFSTNWLMGMASHPLGGGQLMLRSMLSIEPATVSDKYYPELFQIGETANGRPIVDGQHPHDFFMELAAEFAVPLAPDTIGYVYAAPVGDPALGPVAYPHRSSALEIPQATLGHHLEDSTHIANSVLTIGAQRQAFGFAISGFHGGEPDEGRWDIDHGRIDSWAIRGTWDPAPEWSAQLSTGHLHNPEALEPGDVQRTTASVTHATTLPNGSWSTSVIWGHNHRDGSDTNGYLVETLYRFANVNYLTGRIESVDRDTHELLEDSVSGGATHGSDIARINALTIGYTRDLWSSSALRLGAGANATIYSIPSELKPVYGSSPTSIYAFLRVH